MPKYTALWRSGLPNAPGWLAGHGKHTEFHLLAALGRDYGRPVPDPGAERVPHRAAAGLISPAHR